MIAAFVRLLHCSNNDRIHLGQEPTRAVIPAKNCLVRFPLGIEYRIFDFFSLRDLVYLDSALTNRSLRKHFRKSLDGLVLSGPVNFLFVEWFRERRCFVNTLVVTSPAESIARTCAITKITELTIRGAADVSAVHMFSLLATCQKLEKLCVGNFSRFQVLEYATFKRPFSLLELHLSGNNNVDNTTAIGLLARCPRLQVLHANNCAKLSEPVLHAVTLHCPDLQEIHFNWCKEREIVSFSVGHPHVHITYDPHSSYSNLFRACKQLKIVDFGTKTDTYRCGGNITPLDVLTLGQNYTHLTHVSLSATHFLHCQRDRTTQLETALVTLAQNNPFIVSLVLEYFHKLSGVALDAIAANLVDLHTFVLRHCGPGGRVDKDGLRSIRTRCLKLTTFAVNDTSCLVIGKAGMLHTLTISAFSYSSLTDATLVHIAEHNYNMQTFSVSTYHLQQVTSIGLSVAVSHWHNLRTFIATGDYGYSNCTLFGVPINAASRLPVIDDSVLCAVIQHCPLLTTLDISGNTKLSNEALSAIGKLVQLQHLKANGCTLMEDSALVSIALACQDLVLVEISQCQVSDLAIRAMARYGSQKLQYVSICKCPRLHYDSIRELIRHSRRLRYLCLYGNGTRMSFGAVSQLPLYCPYMEMLDIGHMGYTLRWSYRQNKQYFDAILVKPRLWYHL